MLTKSISEINPMSRHEKIAWYNLIVLSIATILFCILFIYIRYEKPDLSLTRQILFGFRGYAFGGLLGLSGHIFRANKSQVDMDERDKIIQQRSYFLGFQVFWVVFIGLHMGVWWYSATRLNMQISSLVLPILVALGGTAFISVQTITTLMLYRGTLTTSPEGS